jgi:NADH:ubiquinone reductase (H+-translocating)
VTRIYHLGAMTGNRARVLTAWILNAADPSESASFGLATPQAVPLDVGKAVV